VTLVSERELGRRPELGLCPNCEGDHSVVGEMLDAADRVKPSSVEERETLERIKACIEREAERSGK
jgi:hypothetical protein